MRRLQGNRVARGRVFAPAVPVKPAMVNALILPPAGGASGPLPPRIVFESASGPALQVRLAPAGGGAGVLPARAVSGQVLFARAGDGGGGALPVTILLGLIPPAPPPFPNWQRDVQNWAIEQERLRHSQALWQYGELAVFCLMWHIEDFTAGLVGRCLRCFDDGSGSPEDQISEAYGQGNQYKCPDCFNTTFEGGFRALIVRPGIFQDMDRDQRKDKRGVVNPGELAIEATPDFRVRAGDYCFRSTGERFMLRVPRRTTLRTGFASPWQQDTAIDYNQLRAAVADPTSVAYVIPPSNDALAQMLGTYTRLPADFSWFEIIRAPLIPGEAPPPAASGRLQPDVTFPLEAP